MSFLVEPSEKIILALDGMSKDDAISLISKIPKLCWVKVGLELFVKSGPGFIDFLRANGKRVFLDLKFHDIPVTMAHACRQSVEIGAELITVHACAGYKAIFDAKQAVVDAAMELESPLPRLLAVTVLTSWSPNDFARDLLINQSLNERVQSLSQLAVRAGIDGCVCSPLEVKELRKIHAEPFELITPGIRLLGEDWHDQKRVLTPSEAILAGASKLVIGRSITTSTNPAEVFERICEELSLVI